MLLWNVKNEQELATAKRAIQQNVGNLYNIKQKELRKNCIKIWYVGEVEHELQDEQLLQKIIMQNNFEVEKGELKILYKSKVAKNRFYIILEVCS